MFWVVDGCSYLFNGSFGDEIELVFVIFKGIGVKEYDGVKSR